MATHGALPPGHAFGEGLAVSQARLFTVLPTHSRQGPARLRLSDAAGKAGSQHFLLWFNEGNLARLSACVQEPACRSQHAGARLQALVISCSRSSCPVR